MEQVETKARNELSFLVHWIYQQGWAPGTGGNFSHLLSREPFRLLMTPSGADKGQVSAGQLLVVDDAGTVTEGEGKPSAETLLHVSIARQTGANVILHTHSIWNTLASLTPSDQYVLSGYEMIKGLSGMASHEDTEVVPILQNSQDIPKLGDVLQGVLDANPRAHAVLLRGHGLYTWGCDIFEARRHLEVFEFLFELSGRHSVR